MSIRQSLLDAGGVAAVCIATAVLTLLWDGNVRSAAETSLLSGSTRLVAYLIVRPADCRSHLEAIRTFERDDLRGRVRFSGVLLVGDGPARRDARRWIAREFPHVRVLRPARYQVRYLRELGWTGAPRLVVLDRKARAIRFARDAPISVEEQRATRRALIAAILA